MTKKPFVTKEKLEEIAAAVQLRFTFTMKK